MISYKAVHKDMSSSFGDKPVYEVGKTYIFPYAERGRGGYHAAEDPLFCLNFIPPSEGRYFKVELQGRLDAEGCATTGADSAAAAEKITLLEELNVEQMLWHAMLYRLSWAKLPVNHDVDDERAMTIADKKGKTVSAHGMRCVAVAKGADSTANASGEYALAIAEGENATATADGHLSLVVTYGKSAKGIRKRGAWHLHLDPDAEPGKQAVWIHEETNK